MRKDRGAITIITLTTILFMLAFLISTFTIIANRRQAQAEIKQQTKEIYEGNVENIDQIYDEYFGEEGESIPIDTADDLFKVATGGYIFDNNKIYKCTADGKYQLQNDISFSVADYLSKYPNAFKLTATRWINIAEQIDNGTLTGTFDYKGHTITETDTEGNVITHEEINYVEYIESTGTQYIDTGFYPTSTTTVRLKFNMTAVTGNVIFGYYVDETDDFRIFNYSSKAYLDYGSGSGYNRIYGGTLSTGTTYNIEFGNRYVKDLDTNTNIISNTEVSFTKKTKTAGIFGDGNLAASSGKLYYCQILDNGVLVRDFRPALDSNGVACLYDKVTKKYFYNSGTGTFNYQ